MSWLSFYKYRFFCYVDPNYRVKHILKRKKVYMLKRAIKALLGKFETPAELRKFFILGLVLFLILGVYWTLRPIKDGVFMSIVGKDCLPMAKLLSLFLIVPLVLVYGKLIDRYPRHRVFYGLLSGYGLLALLFSWGLGHPVYGIANSVTDSWRLIGWAQYVWIESFGSLIVALFWAITTDSTMPESAKRGFPLLALGAQLGNICGPLFLRAERFGFSNSAPIVGILGLLMFATAILFWYLMKTTPKELMVGYKGESKHNKTETGFFEGLWLLLSHWYLIGMFLITSIYGVIITIFDNHFKQSVGELFSSELLRTQYLNDYAVWTGIVSTTCVLLGINSIQRRFGITASLILTPLLVALAVVVIKANPLAIDVAFWVMVLSKGVNYALNAPTLKQLYIPTSKDTRYKSQAWIDMFGSRGAKGGSSAINQYRGLFIKQYGLVDGLNYFWTMALVLSFGLIGVWLFFALYVAKTYNKTMEQKQIVC